MSSRFQVSSVNGEEDNATVNVCSDGTVTAAAADHDGTALGPKQSDIQIRIFDVDDQFDDDKNNNNNSATVAEEQQHQATVMMAPHEGTGAGGRPVAVLLPHQQQQPPQLHEDEDDLAGTATGADNEMPYNNKQHKNNSNNHRHQHNGSSAKTPTAPPPTATRLATETTEKEPLCAKQQQQQHNMALYEDDCSKGGQNIGQMLRSLSLYNAILPTAVDEEDKESTAKGATNGGVKNGEKERNGGTKGAPKRQTAKLGTIMGVYIPCLQNIFGVLFFIRLPWIVGTAGILEAFMVVLLCCSVTFLTSISLSAIATNGVVSGGGPYYMISRNLGPELGGAVGVLFYLGTTVAASMYIIGAVEIFLIYIMPQAKLFEDMYHNFRLFGSLLLILVGLIVLAGVKIVNKFALPAVLIVIACIVFTFVGIFLKFDGSDSLQFCMVGNRPVDLSGFERQKGFVPECSAEGLRKVFCVDPATNANASNGNNNNNNIYNGNGAASNGPMPLNSAGAIAETTTSATTTTRASRFRNHNKVVFYAPSVVSNCDRYFERVLQKDPSAIRMKPAIPGISSGVFFENLYSKYRRSGNVLTKLDSSTGELPPENRRTAFWVFTDTTTSFMILVGVFFPSVTGIMAGSNRSGNLRDASRSIPIGTLGAQLTTSVVYMAGAVLFGSSVAEMFIRDKFGQSAMGRLVIAELAIPNPLFILIGCCSSTIGAGMQSLTGAPRLLQAISADDVIPFLRPFQKTDARGEPIRAIFLTLCICWLGILIAVIENITALITQFFLMCYLGVNAACALQSLLKAPGWRPSFKYFHWSLSTLGAFLCVSVMFISAWYFALVAIFIGAAVYKYIEYMGAEKEWGDGLKGLALSAARFALLNVDSRGITHTRNWRPQLLVLHPSASMSGLFTDLESTRRGLLAFVGQLKAGKGLTLVAECVEGKFAQMAGAELDTIRQNLHDEVKASRIRGFCDVLVADQYIQGVSHLIQTSGLGGLRHNSVVCAWPQNWSASGPGKNPMLEANRFAELVRTIAAAGCAVLVPKYASAFPSHGDRLTGTIDIYWVVHDGGLLMLIPFLLIKHKTWKNTKVRLFTFAQPEDNTLQMKRDLERFLYHLRIEAQVFVLEIDSTEIEPYVYQRTLKIEERVKLLREMGTKSNERVADIQVTMDEAVLERKYSRPDSARRRSSTVDPDAPSQDSAKANTLWAVHEESEEEGKQQQRQQPRSTEQSQAARTAPANDDDDNGTNGSKVRFIDNSVEIHRPSLDSADSLLPSPVKVPPRATTTSNTLTVNNDANGSQTVPSTVARMHTAMKLNQHMRELSADAQLLIVNLPGPPEVGQHDAYYMEFIEALTEGIRRVLLVRGTGSEVVTIYS
ncbi:hypothetical protein niasHT_014104 [Heterodera trifolii]|uniref:Uncharacterized protein n=1 Tax=Heterodera trifolii TaxID=157864 RepID=A0ABD2LGB4_9BILA